MKFTERIIGMMVKPDETTKDINNDPRIEEGLLIVGIYMILSIISTYLAISHIQYVGEIQGISASALATITVVGGVIAAIAIALIGWPIIAGICHLLSMFFGGAGKFYPHLLTLIGYTAIPLVIVTLIGIVLTAVMPVTTVDISQGAAQTATSKLLSDPITLLSIFVQLIGSIWTALMMVYAVKNGEKISRGNAIIIVAVLFIVNLAYTFSSVIYALMG
jgi:hypothetical protein